MKIPLLISHARVQREPATQGDAVPLIKLGHCYLSFNVVLVLAKQGARLDAMLDRLEVGDYGIVGMDWTRDNDLAIPIDGRVVSLYRVLADDVMKTMTPQQRRHAPFIWIVTEKGTTIAFTELDR